MTRVLDGLVGSPALRDSLAELAEVCEPGRCHLHHPPIRAVAEIGVQLPAQAPVESVSVLIVTSMAGVEDALRESPRPSDLGIGSDRQPRKTDRRSDTWVAAILSSSGTGATYDIDDGQQLVEA